MSDVKLAEKVSPMNGGCWFCETKTDDMWFDTEFDTYVHSKCVENALAENPEHPEAKFMEYLLDSPARFRYQLINIREFNDSVWREQHKKNNRRNKRMRRHMKGRRR